MDRFAVFADRGVTAFMIFFMESALTLFGLLLSPLSMGVDQAIHELETIKKREKEQGEEAPRQTEKGPAYSIK